MKRLTLYLMTGLCMAAATAQNVTYNHDAAKQNQFTVAEIGSGTLTPDLYYTLLHNSYRKTASAKNKLSFRTTAGIAGYWQVDDAEKLDSAMTKRAEIEALNVADRTGGALDVAWLAEGDKINSKMADFKKNIDRIIQLGGSPDQQAVWKEYYNVFLSAIKATQQAYMPNSQRKKQYLRIYADVSRKNEELVRYLVYLSNSKTTVSQLASRYDRENKNAMYAAEALARWRDACWRTTGNNVSQP